MQAPANVKQSSTLERRPNPRGWHAFAFFAFMFPLVVVCRPQFTGSIIGDLMPWVGYVLVILGAYTCIYSAVFIEGNTSETLAVEGMFSIMRNPFYVGSLVALLGIGLETMSFTFLVLLVSVPAIYYMWLVGREEKFLEQKFGELYRSYKTSTPRFIPNRGLWNCPPEVTAKPRFFLRTMLYSALYFIPFPVLHALMRLREAGYVTMLLEVP